METVINSLNNFKKEIILALALVIIGAGYTASTDGPYSARVSQVDAMMQELISNPTEAKLDDAYWALWEQGQWSGRNPLEGHGTFEEYLEACNSVRLDVKAGNTPELSEMNKLKKDLI